MLLTPWLCMKHFITLAGLIGQEVRYLYGRRQSLSLAVVKTMIHDLIKAMITAHHLQAIIRKNNLKDTITLYSYWLTSSALASLFVQPKESVVKRIARAHGGDVYETRNALGYLSFRKALSLHLDRIFATSDAAARHLTKQVGADSSTTISVSRLGTHGERAQAASDGKTVTIVSCSFMVPVKRINLMIEALACLQMPQVTWIHIGDGALKEAIEAQASAQLSGKENITYRFMGAMSNNYLMQFYETHYIDLFLNTSASEGLPVTIMKAQSFGIPVIAPAVGGIAEIVSPENGRLFAATATAAEVAHLIGEVLGLPHEAYAALRKNSMRNWESRYNAARNFPTFVSDILKL
jgi:glycosyltransferase involved in cell wall biosynthesis